MLYRLAVVCGVWDVDWLAEQLTARQIGEWMAYLTVEPFGPSAWDNYYSMLASLWCKKSPTQLSLRHPLKRKQSADEIFATFKALAHANSRDS